eukprot:TRINITY_DN4038_c0_g2_i1.p1 TRINITY_DN4038_c0_g2~~TRINITY_DN4038_c0_g2_i1.p1  ORF type:complete len:281 (+),score=53.83 TRINITY_DN4038_c0_g2_i1:140-982(+)
MKEGTNKYIQELKRIILDHKKVPKAYTNSREKTSKMRHVTKSDRQSGIDNIVNSLKRYRKAPQKESFLIERHDKKNNRSVSMPRANGNNCRAYPCIDSTQIARPNCSFNRKDVAEYERSNIHIREVSSYAFEPLLPQTESYDHNTAANEYLNPSKAKTHYSSNYARGVRGKDEAKCSKDASSLHEYAQARDTTKSSDKSIATHAKGKSELSSFQYYSNAHTIPVVSKINLLLENQESLSVEDMHFCFVSFYQKKSRMLREVEKMRDSNIVTVEEDDTHYD